MEFNKADTRNDFNPRPRKEGDQSSQTRNNDGKDFNPRPRKEGDKAVRHA